MSCSQVLRLQNEIKHYEWGDAARIYELLGVPARGLPAAELWLGAHPGGGSALASGEPLAAAAARDPAGFLGAGRAALPFLLKYLAVARPLSVQCHPSLAAARAGYAAEEAAGVPRGAPERVFRDANHKPELVVAAPALRALCGFRDYAEIESLFEKVGIPELSAILTPDLRRLAANALALRDSPGLVARLAERARALAGPPFAELAAAAALHPGDAGLVFFLLLRLVELRAGEALYVPAGAPHAYLAGAAVEVMASSDNVLRGGLTAKHVDRDGLLAILRPCKVREVGGVGEGAESGVVKGVENEAEKDAQNNADSDVDENGDGGSPLLLRPTGGRTTYACPAREFALTRLAGAQELAWDGARPAVVLVVAGECALAAAEGETRLRRGESCYVRPGGAVRLRADGEVYVAAPGE